MTRCVAIIEDFARVSPNVIPHAAALSTIESGALIAEGLAAVVAGNAAAANAVAGKKVRQRKEKKSKDPNAPKRPPSAYLLFQNEVREKVKTEHPDMAYRELLGVIAQRWKALTEEQKNTYENSYSLATEDFRRRDTAYKLDGTVSGVREPSAVNVGVKYQSLTPGPSPRPRNPGLHRRGRGREARFGGRGRGHLVVRG